MQRLTKKRFLLALTMLFFATVSLANRDSDFLSAKEAFQRKDVLLLNRYAEVLQKHELWPYVDYFQLRSTINTADSATIQNFLARHEGSLVADRMRSDWTKILGKGRQWQLFDKEYPQIVNKDTELQCYYYQRYWNIKNVAITAEVRALWFSSINMPDSCPPVFQALIDNGQISLEEIWKRIRLALSDGKTTAAIRIGRYLSNTNEALNAKELDRAARNPKKYLDTIHGPINSRSNREIALFALLQLLRNDTDQALAQWYKVKNRLPASDRSYFLVKLGYRAAMRHDSRALNWFKEAQNGLQPYPASDKALGWHVRAALRARNWNEVLAAIKRMSSAEQQFDSWRYWKARALSEKKQTSESQQILTSLSEEPSFYGQLAKEELGKEFDFTDKAYQVNDREVSAMSQRPGIQRALAFARMQLRTEAYHEWSWTVRDFTDAELLTAAEVARRHGLYDRAINTANRTVTQHDFKMRFLAPHREIMKNIVRVYNLDEALVYGLIRQESRFITNIRSHAGAMGLMQLMPATASWAAKKLGVTNFQQYKLADASTNLQLGTYYLHHVLSGLQNQPLLALAAYNAGPGRARRWQDNSDTLEGAIYAETIPFNETRDYVKKVMENAMYYAKILNPEQNTPTLKQRLGVVLPK
ncbi:lytic transglycosylase domain-containing protein [Nitrosomonas sp. PY1]|uniref:lytic transglycosylase domain-containing protein n=1 Tax=Nitrosomonas sp. PY1 TaxID=1803906 RepID=UPI001FC8031B|nr:lytic transglycosylase domain-containing protein [Nitrosomonas sp. PY1]